MNAKRFDLITLTDLDFGELDGKCFARLEEHFPINNGRPDADLPKDSEGKLYNLFKESAEWIFQGYEGYTTTLPDAIRYQLPSIAEGGGESTSGDEQFEACLLASSKYAVGVIAVWMSKIPPPQTDLQDLRKELHDRGKTVVDAWNAKLHEIMNPKTLLKSKAESATTTNDGEPPPVFASSRYYPMASAWSAIELSELFKNPGDVQYLGRIFTGNSEWDDPASLSELILEENLSKRNYERLYIRWTDAFAIYGSDNTEYERTLFRAVQIFEYCIFVDCLFRSSSRQTDDLMTKVTGFWPNPFALNKRLQESAEIKRTYLASLPVHSSEGKRMLSAALKSYGIVPGLIDSVDTELNLLVSRYQWSKTQFMAAIALAAYLADKLGFFELISHLLWHRWIS